MFSLRLVNSSDRSHGRWPALQSEWMISQLSPRSASRARARFVGGEHGKCVVDHHVGNYLHVRPVLDEVVTVPQCSSAYADHLKLEGRLARTRLILYSNGIKKNARRGFVWLNRLLKNRIILGSASGGERTDCTAGDLSPFFVILSLRLLSRAPKPS